MEISRTGLRLTTPLAVEVGQRVTATLSYQRETVEVSGVVRWRRQAGRLDESDEALASWDVGVAFTSVGDVAADGLWRTLAAHRSGSTES